MARSLLLVAAAASFASAQSGVYSNGNGVYTVTQDTGGDVPLASKHFTYPDLPYHADSGDGPRGTQQGYNLCNSSTLGPTSRCQTGFLNSLSDFCLWGALTPNSTVADEEEEMVAYCTTDKYGTRVLPPGALQGVQFIQTPDYVEIVGYIDQTALNLQASDYGGEEDPHGADQRGNPLGSLMFSSAFGNGTLSPYQQVTEWSYFVGSGLFCFKACDPAGSRAAELCQHIYDRVGCTYNDPVDYAAINGTFTSCLGDDQLPPGVYVENGQTMTYFQPAESLGPITTVPYTPSIPATSSCTTYSSNQLYSQLASGAGVSSAASSAVSGAPTASASQSAAVQAANAKSGADSISRPFAFASAGLLTIASIFAML